MKSIEDYIQLAAQEAVKRIDCRQFLIGAVGIRNDGVTVYSRNLPAPNRTPKAHAEARLVCKLTPDSEVYVARVKRDGSFGSAKPCINCEKTMISAGVKRVYYTTDDGKIEFLSFF